jgi:hypothetical protein
MFGHAQCAVVEMCMCVFRLNKDVLWIVGVLCVHFLNYGNIWLCVFTSCNNSVCELVTLLC